MITKMTLKQKVLGDIDALEGAEYAAVREWRSHAASRDAIERFSEAYIEDEGEEGVVLVSGPIVDEGTRALLEEFGLPAVSPETFA